MKLLIAILMCLLFLGTTRDVFAAEPIVGIGIISASNSEEYQTIPIRYNNNSTIKTRVFNWMELLAKEGYNFGQYRESGTSWPSTADYGYEYNWAKSGATTSLAISQQQHTHLAAQVSDGKVSHVVISIGANDFNPFLSPQNNNPFIRLYNGTDSVQTRVNQVYGNINTMISTIEAANAKTIIIVNKVPNPFFEPQIQQLFPNTSGQNRVRDAVNQINQNLDVRASNSQYIATADTLAVYSQYMQGPRSNSNGFLFGTTNKQIYTNRTGFDGQSYRLADDIGHAGTVLSGIEANGIFIKVLNDQFGYSLPLISEDKILAYAGVQPFPSITPTITISPSPTITSEPLAGDINNDGKVDILDHVLVLSNFGKVVGQDNLLMMVDLNHNGKIDIYDYSLIVTNFGN